MTSADRLVGLAVTCAVLIVIPGPSVLFIVGRALSYGRRTALASVAGNTLGCYLAAAGVAVGLGPVLQRSDFLFQSIKLLGAAYLVWLGVQALRHSRRTADGQGAGPAEQHPWRAVRAGFLVGVTNPKSFIIFAAILPQFIDRASGHVPVQMLLLALVPVTIGLVTDSAWGLAAGHARHWLASSPRRMTNIGRVGGLSMIGLGVSVAVTGRHE